MPIAPTHLERYLVATIFVGVGTAFIFFCGFHHSHILHNAAHDVRHAFAFPCH